MTPEAGAHDEIKRLLEDIRTTTAELAANLGFKPGQDLTDLRKDLTS